ncbi:MAG: MBOAT family protein [Bacteroidia bacterium]|nr:MBOAT family protein [Bacteroidia bacterium]
MLFNSIDFIWFFVIVTTLYFAIPHKFRWFMLLTASCFFYMSFIPVYILILLVTIVIDYFAGIWIERSEGKKRKVYLIASIISTCAVLFVFKYFNFFNANMQRVADFFHWKYPIEALSIILPIGLSFHTFQSLSYVIEVYRGNQKAEKHFGIYSLYVMFYPQLVAGPIERPQNLLHQFYEKHNFDYKRVTDGLKLMAWGMFKKVVIADNLATYVNQVYGNVHGYSSFPLIIATIFFTYQIYCDFSGYSDIAIGSAQVMGFKLMNNFHRPYFSKSISEFWKRWHISLSTWFKDYVYISMGGNRVSKPRQYFNLFITFLISGFWHGANWTFVAWGALNGFYLVFAELTKEIRARINSFIGLTRMPKFYKLWNVAITFGLIALGWVFFRASSIGDALYVIKTMIFGFINDFKDVVANENNARLSLIYLSKGKLALLFFVLPIIIMETIYMIQRRKSIRSFLSAQPAWLRLGTYYLLLISIIFFGQYDADRQQFIYFQF